MAERALRDLPFFFLIVISIFLGCAQRDNLFDPSSPGYVGTLSGIYVSNGYDKNFVLLNYGDSNFVVRPGTKVFFEAKVLDSLTGDPLNLKVRVRASQVVEGVNSPYTYENDNFTSDSIPIGDTGRVAVVFTTGDPLNVVSERRFLFTVKQNRMPMISMFGPAVREANIVWVGKQENFRLRTEIFDPDSLLDSIIYSMVVLVDTLPVLKYDTLIIKKNVVNQSAIYVDTQSLRCFSNIPGDGYAYVRFIDNLGRSDSTSTVVYFSLIDLRKRPDITKLVSTLTGKDSNEVRFVPTVVTYNGNESAPTYQYEFGDSKFSYSNDPIGRHTYLNSGTYSVRLIVTDDGVSDTFADTIVISDLKTTKPAKIYKLVSAPDSGEVILNANFEIVLNSEVTSIDDVKAVEWRFGDGSKETGGNSLKTTHKYEKHGKFIVQAIISSNSESDTAYDTISVEPAHIRYSPMWTLNVGDTASFWLANPNQPYFKLVRWTVADSVSVLKAKDTLKVLIKSEGYKRVKAEAVADPSSDVFFPPWTIESITIDAERKKDN